MVREVQFDTNSLIGKPIMFNKKKVGYIVSIKNNGTTIKCAIDDDNAIQLLRGDQASFSLEVVSK